MLMQSAHGYINVLPALPKVWNKQGDVKGMKAMGNFTVDFNWSAGKCQQIKIVSHAGAELLVRCARGARAIKNAMVTVDGVEVGFWVDKNDVAHIECEKGNIVEIDFTAEGTQIDTMDAEPKNGKIYTVDGRQVSKMQPKTIYIIDGKKVIF